MTGQTSPEAANARPDAAANEPQPYPHRRGVLTGFAGVGLAGVLRPSTVRRPWPPLPIGRGGLFLSNLQLAGQRVIYSYPGLTVPSSLLTDIENSRCAGVIFFGENISSAAQIAGVVRQLRAAQAASLISQPLLLMTDQEGGEVRRLPGAPTSSEKTIGASANPTGAAASAGTGAGQNLAGVGMNVNLAPVLDVYYTAGDFDDQYQRSYSHNPATAAACGGAFIKAQQTTGVAATAKHFPGLGSATASQNTDTGPVTLNVSLSQLRGTDEVPYPTAVAAGVKLVMVSWAIYPALDPSLPAGLSPAVVQQELRVHNNFTGVTITDALEAGALAAHGTTQQRAVAAAYAGMDLILCSARDVSQGEQATAALASAYAGGQLEPTPFNASVARVQALRSSLS
jgi:beta-N-acetylhexosaminidase